MKHYPKVTIMIPTYNQSQYIKQAVESALAQDYSNIEIIVSDDSTNNKTRDILEEYVISEKIRYYHNKPRLGRVENYYHTLRNYPTGEWILNLDGDDFLVNDKFISKSIEILEKDNNIAMVFGREMIFNETTHALTQRETSLTSSQVLDGNEVFFKKRELRINFYHLSTLYSREKAVDVGFYEDNCLGVDTLSLMKLLINNKVAFINEIGGAWRVHDKNDSFTEDIDILIENIKCQYKLKDFLKKQKFDKNKINSWVDKNILNKFEIYMISLLKKRKFQLARKLLLEFKKNYPYLVVEILKDYKKILKLFIVFISPKLYTILSK
ncbi:MAG TPA: glycosyltransferase family 2 protein [Arcobacter sp.]|nr:glycosyltransferase family 2 protein [Arcobacter sp.]